MSIVEKNIAALASKQVSEIDSIKSLITLLAEMISEEELSGYLEAVHSNLESLSKTTAELHSHLPNGMPLQHSGATPEKISVLFVDNDPVQRIFVQRVLEKAGMSIMCAKDGKEGFELFNVQPWNVIVMDCEMPVVDGFDLTRAIRLLEAKKKLTPTPIIAFTGHTVTGYKERCLEVGMNDYITKPVSSKDLVQRIQNALSIHMKS